MNELRNHLANTIKTNLSNDVWNWLAEKVLAVENNNDVPLFTVVFASIPRRIGRAKIIPGSSSSAHNLRLHINSWTVDRLCRVWLIMHLNSDDQHDYVRIIENLFLTAELNEQVALYSALPILAHPPLWRGRCSEGIRSNIADVLEAIMLDNIYPSENLDQAAWNQLVLKAIFTDKPIHRILNIDRRANQELANTLSDYAHERWAANRQVNPMLWRCVGKFINASIYADIERLVSSENIFEREAAALACANSEYPQAVELLQKKSEMRSFLASGSTWNNLAQQMEAIDRKQ